MQTIFRNGLKASRWLQSNVAPVFDTKEILKASTEFSNIATFFFQIFYIQFKINKLLSLNQKLV